MVRDGEGVVLIIGAGIGGLTTAIACRRAGLEYAVFERVPAIHPVGAGIALWRNALRVYDTLGIGDRMRRLGKPNIGAALRTWDGQILTPSLTASDARPARRTGRRRPTSRVARGAAGRGRSQPRAPRPFVRVVCGAGRA